MEKYKIEVNSETTLKGLLESFKNLKEAGLFPYVQINGVTIKGDDSNLAKRLENELDKYKTLVRDAALLAGVNKTEIEENTEIDPVVEITNLRALANDDIFKFHLGVCLRFSKDEYREQLMDYYIQVYSDNVPEDIRKDLNYVASLLLILNRKEGRKEKIAELINSIGDNELERQRFNIAIDRVKQYGELGWTLDKLLYTDVLDERLKQVDEKIEKVLNKRK